MTYIPCHFNIHQPPPRKSEKLWNRNCNFGGYARTNLIRKCACPATATATSRRPCVPGRRWPAGRSRCPTARKTCRPSWSLSGCRPRSGSRTGSPCGRAAPCWPSRCPPWSLGCRWSRCCPGRRTPRSYPRGRTRTSSPTTIAAGWRAPAGKGPKVTLVCYQETKTE